MKTRLKIPEKERAARLGQQAAPQRELHSTLYRQADPVSTLQSEIGTLLLCLQFPVGQEVSQVGWQLCERLLRRYVGLRISQHGRQSVDTTPESTNASQRIVG